MPVASRFARDLSSHDSIVVERCVSRDSEVTINMRKNETLVQVVHVPELVDQDSCDVLA